MNYLHSFALKLYIVDSGFKKGTDLKLPNFPLKCQLLITFTFWVIKTITKFIFLSPKNNTFPSTMLIADLRTLRMQAYRNHCQ